MAFKYLTMRLGLVRSSSCFASLLEEHCTRRTRRGRACFQPSSSTFCPQDNMHMQVSWERLGQLCPGPFGVGCSKSLRSQALPYNITY
eukprot:450850-Amphidinium_carterae.1